MKIKVFTQEGEFEVAEVGAEAIRYYRQGKSGITVGLALGARGHTWDYVPVTEREAISWEEVEKWAKENIPAEPTQEVVPEPETEIPSDLTQEVIDEEMRDVEEKTDESQED